MKIKEIMRTNVPFCTLETPLQEVVRLLLENEGEFITVVESYAHNNPVGVVTERDICLRTIGAGVNPLKTDVGKVMNFNVGKISCDASVDECRELLSSQNTAFLLVTDDQNACCGIVKKEDLPPLNKAENYPAYIHKKSSGNMTVRNYSDRIF